MKASNQARWDTKGDSQLTRITEHGYDTIVINTYFDSTELQDSSILGDVNKTRLDPVYALIDRAQKLLKEGGLLFVYGLPRYLSTFAVYLNEKKYDDGEFLFKYWIALEFKAELENNRFPTSHAGMLMYLKTKDKESPIPFELNTKLVRVPYSNCAACGLNTRDWGGKKHLLNKLGAALSDIWTFNDLSINMSSKIPQACLNRLYELTKKENSKMLLIQQGPIKIGKISQPQEQDYAIIRPFKEDQVICADSLELMRKYTSLYPSGVFDLVFADPPYNLAKNYAAYKDTQADRKYIEWCNSWLELMIKVLRPGGSLFVLNIPKWAVHHAEFLSKKMEFHNWIVWDALSSPAGKLMPAHYALLYYTKPRGKPTINYTNMAQIDSRKYCLRNSCIMKRKSSGDDQKEFLTDIWHDIHRIKHTKDRDAHPCQLPIKLMNRIIELFTNPEDWVYDPFAGAGTTAVSARICNRHFVVSDIDPKYVDITNRNLERIVEDLQGNRYIVRKKVKRGKKLVSKREIEVEFLTLCKEKGKVIPLDQLKSINHILFAKITNEYVDYKKLHKIANRQLEIENVSADINLPQINQKIS